MSISIDSQGRWSYVVLVRRDDLSWQYLRAAGSWPTRDEAIEAAWRALEQSGGQ
jgi:hypothetical protein